MTDFAKVVRIGTTPTGRVNSSVYCKIAYRSGRLRITGVVGPRPSGNCLGSCGQIALAEYPIASYAPGWSVTLAADFAALWRRWHLNNLRPGTPAQMAHLETLPRAEHAYDRALVALRAAGLQPDGDYSYGSAWLTEEVPADVLAFLQALPDADRPPAWV